MLKKQVTTNQKHTIDSQKTKGREHKHNTKENHQTTGWKKEEQSRNTELTRKQG